MAKDVKMASDGMMTVRVVDRSTWGTMGPYPLIRCVTISTTCPKCGGPRGTPRPYTFHDNGDWHTCDRWENPCGHVDKYDDVLREAGVACEYRENKSIGRESR